VEAERSLAKNMPNACGERGAGVHNSDWRLRARASTRRASFFGYNTQKQS
jgi:hypothetical protein